MLAKTREERTTRKNQRMYLHVLTVVDLVYLTEYAHIVASTQENRLFMRGQNNSSASSSKRIHLGVDLLGSDTPTEEFFPSIFSFIKNHPEIHLTLFGKEEHAPAFSSCHQVSFVSAPEMITMEDSPLLSIRKKKNASLCLGIKALGSRHIDAFISAGNTGALIASAKMSLPMLKGIERPALLVLLPTKRNPIAVLDVGANISYKPKHLLQFANMDVSFKNGLSFDIS